MRAVSLPGSTTAKRSAGCSLSTHYDSCATFVPVSSGCRRPLHLYCSPYGRLSVVSRSGIHGVLSTDRVVVARCRSSQVTPDDSSIRARTRRILQSQCHDAQQLGVDAILANHRDLRVSVVPARIDSSSVASTSRSSEAWLR
jgi:hypothetical protein